MVQIERKEPWVGQRELSLHLIVTTFDYGWQWVEWGVGIPFPSQSPLSIFPPPCLHTRNIQIGDSQSPLLLGNEFPDPPHNKKKKVNKKLLC
ncbi:unnamed protein product [Prunus armeniaca]